jgi:hypothetical protein
VVAREGLRLHFFSWKTCLLSIRDLSNTNNPVISGEGCDSLGIVMDCSYVVDELIEEGVEVVEDSVGEVIFA